MRILIVLDTKIPVTEYGGTERVVWWLGKELSRRKHSVTYLARLGSHCPFARVIPIDPAAPLAEQIPEDIDVVHFHCSVNGQPNKPYLITHHGNFYAEDTFDINTVFVSRNHAQRNSSETFVYNGLDPEDYGPVDWSAQRKDLLFLGYAKRPDKNLKGSALIARQSGHVLRVAGGKHKWFKWRPWLKYLGMLGGAAKTRALNSAEALVFPMLWNEPFGLAVIEALYFGCPVLATPYGSLPELINEKVGVLSDQADVLIEAAKDLEKFDRRACHEHVLAHFTAKQMTDNYLEMYEKVMRGHTLNLKSPVNGGNYDSHNLLPFRT